MQNRFRKFVVQMRPEKNLKIMIIPILCIFCFLRLKIKEEIVAKRENFLIQNFWTEKSPLNSTYCDALLQETNNRNYHESCKGLFANGSLIPKCRKMAVDTRFCYTNLAEAWNPNGCKLRFYSDKEIAKCFRTYAASGRDSVYMFGDSRVRYLFEAFQSRLRGLSPDQTKYKRNREYFYKEGNIHLKFRGVLCMNSSIFQGISNILNETKPPILVFGGAALHIIQSGGRKNKLEFFDQYQKNFTKLRPLLMQLSEKGKLVWMLQAPVIPDGQWIDLRIPYRAQIVDLYNDFAIKLLENTGVTLMKSILQVGALTMRKYKDETHLGVDADGMVVEMLLNYICNNQFEETEEKYCCSKQDKVDFISTGRN